jgi:hypothetical protein
VRSRFSALREISRFHTARVNRVGLTLRRPLPVHPQLRTYRCTAVSDAMCQYPTCQMRLLTVQSGFVVGCQVIVLRWCIPRDRLGETKCSLHEAIRNHRRHRLRWVDRGKNLTNGHSADGCVIRLDPFSLHGQRILGGVGSLTS